MKQEIIELCCIMATIACLYLLMVEVSLTVDYLRVDFVGFHIFGYQYVLSSNSFLIHSIFTSLSLSI